MAPGGARYIPVSASEAGRQLIARSVGRQKRWLATAPCAPSVLAACVGSPTSNVPYYTEPNLLSESQIARYSAFLIAVGEPPLAMTRADEAFRLLVLPAFDNPIAVTIEVFETQALFRVVEFERGYRELAVGESRSSDESLAIAYGSGRVVAKRQGSILEPTWSRVASGLRSTFWALPPTIARQGFDGETWVLEGLREKEHHVVVRWVPEPSEFRSLFEALLNAVGADPRDLS